MRVVNNRRNVKPVVQQPVAYGRHMNVHRWIVGSLYVHLRNMLFRNMFVCLLTMMTASG